MPPYLEPGDAPWAGGGESAELLSAALGISMRQSSFADGPVDPVYPHLLYEQGLWAAACAVSALVERERSGLGQEVTVSGAHGALVAGSATFLVDPGPRWPRRPGRAARTRATRATSALTASGCSSGALTAEVPAPRARACSGWPR